MDENQIKALVRIIEQIMGNPIEMDAGEIEALFTEFGQKRAPAQSVFNLASSAAQKYRLDGQAVPSHVSEALDAVRKKLSKENPESIESVLNAALKPILGPVQEVSYAFRNRVRKTEKDANLLEELSDEVKRDWTEDKEK